MNERQEIHSDFIPSASSEAVDAMSSSSIDPVPDSCRAAPCRHLLRGQMGDDDEYDDVPLRRRRDLTAFALHRRRNSKSCGNFDFRLIDFRSLMTLLVLFAACLQNTVMCVHPGSTGAAAATRDAGSVTLNRSLQVKTYATPDLSGDVINGVRCRVRCLSLLQTNLEAAGGGMSAAIRESVTLLNCLREPDCEACLRPCNQPFVSDSVCEEACRLPHHDAECRRSCQFLKRVNSIRPGRCPPETQATGFAAICVTACDTDADCPTTSHKCCSNSCGWTCQQPLQLYDGVPEIPDRPSSRERPRGVELKWNSVSSNESGPILYIVDFRWNVGPSQNEAEMTSWQQIAQTTGLSTLVTDITPGHWYQFRVTAVNLLGSRGGSPATNAFTLSKEPRKPGAPTNLTEGDTLIMGDKVAVTLHWFPPRKSDLPVSRYKLYWSKKPRSSSQMALREFRQIVPGDQLVFQIPDLEPDTTYFVQVQAICHYGETRLKSDRANIYVTTYPLPHSSDTRSHSNGDVGRKVSPTNAARSLPTPPAPVDLVSDSPVFHNGILKANISWSFTHDGHSSDIDRVFVFWSPEACIADSLPDDGLSKVFSGNTHDNFFVIYDLRFDCRYLVRIQSVTNQGVSGAMSPMTVSTPSCHDVIVVGKVRPDCPHNVPRIPEEPSDLQHSFLISSSNITAKITWSMPRPLSSSESPLITGYRVVWGHSSSTHMSIMDKATALTKVLTKDTRTFSLSNLMEGTNYLVRVQALSKSGSGRVASIQFTTPLLQLTPLDLPYNNGDENDEDDDDEDDIDDYGSNDRGSLGGGGAIKSAAATVWSSRYWESADSRGHQLAPHGSASESLHTRTSRMCLTLMLVTSVMALFQRHHVV